MSEEGRAEGKSFIQKYKKGIYLFLILLFPSLFYIALTTGRHNIINLPYYGPREAVTTTVNGKEVIDTVYHSVPPFSFLNQSGRTITEADYKGKIYVTDFFFTSCPTICPKMTSQLVRLQDRFKDYPDVAFLSHTVDPDNDSVEKLRAYAERVKADTSRWHFVTGKKEEIYRQALEGYMLSAMEDDLAPGGFLHSEMMVLVDKQGHIRGFYDGTSVDEVNKLIDAMKVLKASELVPRKQKK